jgi:hypothetical protein
MPLPFQVESIDAVPEAQRSLYKETNGKFVLDVDGYEDPTNLKSALQKEREAAKTATKQAQAWAALGKTPEEIQALVEAQAQAERDKLVKGGEWDKLKAQMLEQQTKEREQLESKLKAKDSAIERHLVDAQATAAIAAAKGVPALLLPHVKASVRVVEDGGEYVVRVVDAAGNPRVDAKGEFLSIADLVGEMRQSEIFGRAFEPTGTTGSGAQGGGSGGTGKVMKQSAIDAMKPAERAKFFASGGIAVA